MKDVSAAALRFCTYSAPPGAEQCTPSCDRTCPALETNYAQTTSVIPLVCHWFPSRDSEIVFMIKCKGNARDRSAQAMLFESRHSMGHPENPSHVPAPTTVVLAHYKRHPEQMLLIKPGAPGRAAATLVFPMDFGMPVFQTSIPLQELEKFLTKPAGTWSFSSWSKKRSESSLLLVIRNTTDR